MMSIDSQKCNVAIDVDDFDRVTFESALKRCSGEAFARLAGCWTKPAPKCDFALVHADARLGALFQVATLMRSPLAPLLEQALAWGRAAKFPRQEVRS